MLRRPAVEEPSPGCRAPLLTPRNLLILAIAGLGAHECVPALLPAVQAGSPPSFVAYIAMVAALDRVITV